MDKRTDRFGKVCYYDVDPVTEWPSNVTIMNTPANIMFTTSSYLEYITLRGLQRATELKTAKQWNFFPDIWYDDS